MPEELGTPIVVRDAKTGAVSQLEMTNFMNGRRLIRTAKNPLDKCTIASIYPREIPNEEKPTIEKGKFTIPAGTFENPSVLVITSSSWWRDYDPDQPIIERPVSSMELAESIVKDYCNSLLEFSGDSHPGIFYVLGEHTSIEIKSKYKFELEKLRAKQDNWYRALVRHADILYARTSGNPIVIMEDMKLAARSLNLNDKPWLKDHQMAEMSRCPACGSMRNAAYPICPTCKNVDINHPMAKDLKFAV